MAFHRLTTIKLLIALLALFGLQYFPYTGIFIMLGMAIAGPYIWGLLPHLLTVGMVLDVKQARLPKTVLAIPAIFYVAYYLFFAFEWFVITQYGENLNKANSSITIAYEAREHSLILPNAARLVEQFAIPVAFEQKENLPLGYLSNRLISQQRCEQIRSIERDLFELRLSGVQVRPENVPRFTQLCGLSNHEAPTKKKLEATLRKVEQRIRWVNFDVAYHDLTSEQQRLGTVATARVDRLPWFPFYVIGCFLNSSKPSWECTARFHGEAWNLPNSEDASSNTDKSTSLIAKTLGLRPHLAADYDQFEDYPENSLLIDSWLTKRRTSKTSDYNEWGVEKHGPYMPKLSVENGHEHYVGGIYPRKEGGEFLSFMKRNVGKIVQITADIGAGVNVSPSQQLVQIWGVCKNSDACVRTDHAFKLVGAEENMYVKKRITGFWKVGEFRVIAGSGADKDTTTILERVFP